MKFYVHDEDGNKFEVEEVTEQPAEVEGELPENKPVSDAELLPEEVDALKKLAAVADKLMSLISSDTDDCGSDPMLDEEEEEEEAEEEEETVVDTDCGLGIKQKDSVKKSIGANENKRSTNDSVEEDTVAAAWAKRYGGKN